MNILSAHVTNWWYLAQYVVRIGESYIYVGDNSDLLSNQLTTCTDRMWDGGFFALKKPCKGFRISIRRLSTKSDHYYASGELRLYQVPNLL